MINSLESAIKHHEEKAEALENTADVHAWNDDGYSELECLTCAKAHRQLANWLKELKAYRKILANADKIIESQYGCVIIEGYADVVDQMIEIYMEEVNADDNN